MCIGIWVQLNLHVFFHLSCFVKFWQDTRRLLRECPHGTKVRFLWNSSSITTPHLIRTGDDAAVVVTVGLPPASHLVNLRANEKSYETCWHQRIEQAQHSCTLGLLCICVRSGFSEGVKEGVWCSRTDFEMRILEFLVYRERLNR